MPSDRQQDGSPHAASPPVRILVVVPCPTDGPQFDPKARWQELERTLKPHGDRGLVALDRLGVASEASLKRRLEESPLQVMHFIGMSKSRSIANYEALVFEGSEGRSRNLTAQYLATLLRRGGVLRLAVLQPAVTGSASLEGVARVLVENGLDAVVSTGHLSSRAQEIFAAKLYSGLATGSTIEEAVTDVRHALAAEGFGDASLGLAGRSPTTRLREPEASQQGPEGAEIRFTSADDLGAQPARGVPTPEPSTTELAHRRELQRKRAECAFDVFLCHNGADKPEVRKIARRLKERGILPWLDECELPPGQPWQALLEQQIASIKSAAVFVGTAGVGPWQEQELYGFLREFVSRKSPVIPVLLPDAPEKPVLPLFLKGMTWVDFRAEESRPLDRLVWGITGRRPEVL